MENPCSSLFLCINHDWIIYFSLLCFYTEKLNLKKVDEYKYLKQSCCYSIAGVDDAQMFRTVTVHCFYTSFFRVFFMSFAPVMFGRAGLVQLVSASSPSHQVLGSKPSLCRTSAGVRLCFGYFFPQTPLVWEPLALGLPFFFAPVMFADFFYFRKL
jgi:hypothetical protein